jgi:hypothetical protein
LKADASRGSNPSLVRVYTADDIQSGSPEVANPATCQDRQGAFAQSRADVAARRGN